MTVPLNAGGWSGRVTPLGPRDPRWFGEFRTVGLLGEGGMGRVYAGHARDGRQVAIKAIRAELARDEGFRARFRREAESARRVPAYATAQVLAADPDAPVPYLVTEYIDGPTLHDLVTGGGPLRGGELHQLAVAVATALKGIHGAGIMHRDLKPGNVLLSRFGPRVIDFGIARAPDATRMTGKDQAVGTPTYMAPEQLRSEPCPASDVFAWGGVVLFAATGRRPFDGERMGLLVRQIMSAEPELGGLPASLRPAVSAAMRKEPDARPTPTELLELLGSAPDAADTHQAPAAGRATPTPAPAPASAPAPAPASTAERTTVDGPATARIPEGFSGPVRLPRRLRSRRRPVRYLSWLLIPVVLAAAFLAWTRRPTTAADPVVTAVTTTVDDRRPRCDDEVDVAGTITTDGAPGEISYQWWRSDEDAPEQPRSQPVGKDQTRTTVHLLWKLHGTGRHRFTATLTVLGDHARQASVSFVYSCAK